MEWFVTVLIFFGVMALTAVLFGGWVVVSIARMIYRAVTGTHWRETPALASTGENGALCARLACRASNPSEARFCRRCGQPMPGAQRVTARRAAMW